MYTAIGAVAGLKPLTMADYAGQPKQASGSTPETTVPMERVRRDQPLSKPEFHRRLRFWLENAEDAIIGPEDVDGRTGWVYVRDGSTVFMLHADTKRDAVQRYLQLVSLYGDDLQWEITESQRGKLTAVVYGPEKIRRKSFYLYAVSNAV